MRRIKLLPFLLFTLAIAVAPALQAQRKSPVKSPKHKVNNDLMELVVKPLPGENTVGVINQAKPVRCNQR